MGGGETVTKILETLSDIGYNVKWEVYNSKNYGVPQNRERVYFKGYLKRECGEEVLLISRAEGEAPSKEIDYFKKSVSQGYNVLNTDGVNGTLTSMGGNSGGSTYVKVNRVYGSNQSNRGETTGDFSTCLASAMGEGGGHVSMVELDNKCDSTVRLNKGNVIQGNRVYSSDGVSACLNTSKGELYDVGEPIIKVEGNVFPSGHASGKVYNTEGLSPCITTDHCNGWKILDKKDKDKSINVIGNVYPSEHSLGNVYDDEGISPTLTCSNSKELKVGSDTLKLRVNTKKGYQEAGSGDGVRLDHPNSTTGRARVMGQSTNTLTTGGANGVVTDDLCIRRLTPVECERLQGFPDNWTQYGVDDEVISDTQRYKCCGNAVTTTVISSILDDWCMFF